MGEHERWDVLLEAHSGAASAAGRQLLRGPVVALGAMPGSGGFALPGCRGLADRHCLITAYAGGVASVVPVGTHQVRVAPHAGVRWSDLEPIPCSVHLTEGCVLHLGPVTRGATVTFGGLRRFGGWQPERLASESAAVGARVGAGGVPASFDARAVGTVRASAAPYWFVGGLSLVMGGTVVMLLGLGGYQLAQRWVVGLGPQSEGYEFYESVDLAKAALDPDLHEGLEKPFHAFVMVPNAEAASDRFGLDDPESWDQRFFDHTTAQVQQQVSAWSVFRTLDQVRDEYSEVTLMLREAGLPEVFAAIPYQESRYFQVREPSSLCALGPWQIMPEVAHRVERTSDIDIRVRDCSFRGEGEFRWSPTELAPPKPSRSAEYVLVDKGEPRCRIERCAVDDRTDLRSSTQASIHTLREAYDDPLLRGSGAVVQIVIASHNAGYDDSRFGRHSRSNLKQAYGAWVDEYGESEGPHFYGRNILTRSHAAEAWGGSKLPPETQHYVYSVVAQHLVAVCYYATNYPEDRAFKAWRHHVTDTEGYCRALDVPSAQEVRGRRA